MKRLAYLLADPGIPVFGTKGASVHVQEIVRAFRRDGWQVTVYATRRGDVVPADLADLDVVELRVPKGETADREQAVAAASQGLARRALDDGCDLAYERYSLFSTAGAEVAASGVPLVVEVNAPLVEEQRQHRELVDGGMAAEATVATFDAASVVACVSEPVASWVRETAPRTGATVLVAPNGVNTERIRPSEHTDRHITVGFVGTLKPWHGVEHLIRAADLAVRGGADRLRLLICGDGPERDHLEELARHLDVDAEFTGAYAPEDVGEHLSRMDVAVAPYPHAGDAGHYFSPLKVYEYLAAGLPVVASAIGQIPQIITDDITGVLVAPADEVGLERALRRLHDDAGARTRLGESARAAAVERHDWSVVLSAILEPLTPLPAAA